jgi:hypothetical protein
MANVIKPQPNYLMDGLQCEWHMGKRIFQITEFGARSHSSPRLAVLLFYADPVFVA